MRRVTGRPQLARRLARRRVAILRAASTALLAALLATVGSMLPAGSLLPAGTIPGAAPATALAAEPDPSAGFDATWTVTRPEGSVRADGAIAVGDDLALSYAAVDGTPVTQCRIAIETADATVNVPGNVVDGTCTFMMRLPDLPSPTWRARWSAPFQEICVYATLWFADDAERAMIPADHLQPGGQPCGNGASQQLDTPRLDFHLDEAGATERPFVSDPQFLSWDPADWDTGMGPLLFGQTWHVALPDWVETCEPMINGTWQTTIRALQPGSCTDWDVRIPGILPEALHLAVESAWDTSLAVNYTVAGVEGPFTVVSFMTVPLEPTDGVFESSLPAVFPMDLAKARFVTVGEEWVPSYQITGTTASLCRLQLYDNQGNDFAMDEVAPDADDQCTFHVPALAANEAHQYHVYAIPESDPTSLQIVFGGSIASIPAPEPPVIEPPMTEPDGDTGLDVQPGDGQGLAVDLEVTAGSTAAADSTAATAGPTTTATATTTATETTTVAGSACSGQAVSPDLAQGGGIPTLEASCALAPGTYTATATMIDAAGVEVTSHRTFTVPHPRPTIASRTPAAGATGVARDIRPSVRFDLDVTGVSASSMRLADSSGTFVTGSVAYDAATHKATFTPFGLLKTSRTYRLYLSNAIHAAGTGRPLTATSWTFSTTSDGVAPTIVGRAPTASATGVARTIVPAVRFSEAIKGVTSTSLQLRDTLTGLLVPATVRYDAATRRATIDPTPSLAANRTYLMIVRSSIRDLAGNPTATTTWSFRTGS